MKVRVFPLDFRAEGGIAYPANVTLHKLAVEYAEKELAEPVAFPTLTKVWMACKVDENDEPVECCGLLGFILKPDFALCRFTEDAAVLKLYARANDFLADQGAMGGEVFVYVSSKDKPEQMCANWESWLKTLKAVPADRYRLTIK